MRVSTIVLL